MSKTWVYADPHFYHKNICKFTKADGSKLRPWDDAEQMTEDLIQWYNECVDDQDRVYILGDVAFTVADMLRSVSRLKGRKCLVPGNHEPKKMKKYIDLFDDVRGYVQRDGFIMSHIPIHSGSIGRWKLNIHGHLHGNVVKHSIIYPVTDDPYAEWESEEEPDNRYFCASVEHTNFRPIDLDTILKQYDLK